MLTVANLTFGAELPETAQTLVGSGRDPCPWVLSHRPGELFAALAGATLYEDQIAELKLGKKTARDASGAWDYLGPA